MVTRFCLRLGIFLFHFSFYKRIIFAHWNIDGNVMWLILYAYVKGKKCVGFWLWNDKDDEKWHIIYTCVWIPDQTKACKLVCCDTITTNVCAGEKRAASLLGYKTRAASGFFPSPRIEACGRCVYVKHIKARHGVERDLWLFSSFLRSFSRNFLVRAV